MHHILPSRRTGPEALTAIGEYSALVEEGFSKRRCTMDDKLQGLVRHVLTAIGGAAVIMGYMDDATVATVVGAAMTLLGFSWSWMSKV
jgi:hypothetical protein